MMLFDGNRKAHGKTDAQLQLLSTGKRALGKADRLQALFNKDLSHFEKLVRRRAIEALMDDAKRDATTEALGIGGNARASIVAQEDGILCGLIEANAVLTGLNVKMDLLEGDAFKKGRKILEIEGDISIILKRERTALNYLQLLSGISTETRKLVEKIGGRGGWERGRGKVAAIRKNHPLLAESEKRAVQVGGGLAHRLNLADCYLIKNTHLQWLRENGGLGKGEAVKFAVEKAISHRSKSANHYFIEIEAMSEDEAVAAAGTEADAILIDNQSPSQFAKIAKSIRKISKKIIIEASGGITPENAKKFIESGADFVSMSHLVMGSRPIKMHLELNI